MGTRMVANIPFVVHKATRIGLHQEATPETYKSLVECVEWHWAAWMNGNGFSVTN